MKYVLNVNINTDGDFRYDSKWVKVKMDNIDNIWFFDKREDAVKALKECYEEVVNSFKTSKEYLIKDIKDNMVNFTPFLDLVFKKSETIKFILDNGNQELYFILGAYDEITKIIDYSDYMYISTEDYNWEAIKGLEDFKE